MTGSGQSSTIDRRTLMGAAAAGAFVFRAGPALASAGGHEAAIRKAVEAQYPVSVARIQDWIRNASIAAENFKMEEGAAYMMALARDAGWTAAPGPCPRLVATVEMPASIRVPAPAPTGPSRSAAQSTSGTGKVARPGIGTGEKKAIPAVTATPPSTRASSRTRPRASVWIRKGPNSSPNHRVPSAATRNDSMSKSAPVSGRPAVSRNGWVVDVTNVDLGQRQFLQIGPRRFDITSDLPEPITLEPVAEGRAVYSVTRGLRVELYGDFEDFNARVNSLLNGGWTMRALTARGAYDVPTTTLEANYVAVAFKAP
mgnify:CR=1 FL=1